jgi:hypothetical protein
MPKAPRSGHGIELNGRNEEQPVDKERAQDPSSATQDSEQQHPHTQEDKRG